MIRSAFLASKHVSGLSYVLPVAPVELRTVFVPTAGLAYDTAPWIDQRRAWLRGNGFDFRELDLTTATPGQVGRSLGEADLVYVEGGNTYFLLHYMKESRFWDSIASTDIIYAGASAGAIVTCPDIAYINGLDDRSRAPDLSSTTGAGVVDFSIMPHMDDARTATMITDILVNWPERDMIVKLNDDQAIILEGDTMRIVHSPPGDLVSISG